MPNCCNATVCPRVSGRSSYSRMISNRVLTSGFLGKARVPLLLAIAIFTAPLIAQKAPPAKPFERYDGCTFITHEWNDGDSFHVGMPDGTEQILRLYFVDCPSRRTPFRNELPSRRHISQSRRSSHCSSARTLQPSRKRLFQNLLLCKPGGERPWGAASCRVTTQ